MSRRSRSAKSGARPELRGGAPERGAREPRTSSSSRSSSTDEEIELALRLASDGALVLATFPASGAAGAVERLVSAFEPESSRVSALACRLSRGSRRPAPRSHGRREAPVAVTRSSSRTPRSATLIREGKTDGLAGAMKSGSTLGDADPGPALERLSAPRNHPRGRARARDRPRGLRACRRPRVGRRLARPPELA